MSKIDIAITLPEMRTFDPPLLQFRTRDTWITIRDYNPDPKTKLTFDDTKAHKYLDPDSFIVNYSEGKVSAKLERGAIKIPNDDLERFRFAIRISCIQIVENKLRYQYDWAYIPLKFEKDPNRSENE